MIMTLPMPRENVKCAVCGCTSRQMALMSTNTFGGGPDLDTRPAEMMRSSMVYWIQECPHCGYISESITDDTNVTEGWLSDKRYTTYGGHEFASELAKKFYKYYLINVADDNAEDAFYAVLHAAWACDDVKDVNNASYCRHCALQELERVLLKGNTKNEFLLVKADLLRRTGQFEELISTYATSCFEEDLFNKIVAFQIEKAEQKDTKCYRVEDVVANND